MICLPPTPEAGGAMLAAYIEADPARRPVSDNLRALLDLNGKVGDRARYYIIRSAFRRATLRGILIATGAKLPDWLHENPDAAASNKAFIEAYREEYNLHRNQERHERRAANG